MQERSSRIMSTFPSLRRSLLLLPILISGLVSCGSTEAVEANSMSAPLVLQDRDGAQHDVQQILRGGEAVTLVFWQTWCESCRAEGPGLARDAEFLKGRARFFGVVSGSAEEVDELKLSTATAEMGLRYPQVRDTDGALAERFGIFETPTILVFGSDGRQLYRGRSAPENWEDLLRG
jgi:thiol-disulfide isomerase/thioredoxin